MSSASPTGSHPVSATGVGTQSLEAENAELRCQVEQVRRENVEYLQNVSHQLVAPLNAIKWHIENLTESRLTVDRAKKVLRSMYSQATIAVHLAKNFALMSNLEADHALSALKEPLQRIDLCRLLVNLADDFQPLAWDKDIQIEVEGKGSMFDSAPPVLAMKPLISQVFSNIIENAVKYSNRATGILISGNHDGSKDVVLVRIRNRGIPLTAEEAAKVFERGYRSQQARSQYPAGTGFGLYIASRIVQIHGGTIEVETDSQGAVIFTVGLSVSGLKGKARERE